MGRAPRPQSGNATHDGRLRNHLETCVAAAMVAGRTGEIVDELMEALRYDHTATGPGPELELRDEGTAS